VECAFGEIDMRWGVFWRPLQFSLEHNVKVIDACLRLNLVVEFRMRNDDENEALQKKDLEEFEQDATNIMYDDPTAMIGVFTNDRNGAPPAEIGRPPIEEWAE